MNLQFFADAGADDTVGDPEDNSTRGSKEESKNPEVTLTKTAEELQILLQSEADKRVTQAIKTAQEKWQTEYETKLKAERFAKLSAEEKEKELLKKQQEEIEKRERAIAQRALELKAIDLLQEKKRPIVRSTSLGSMKL